MDSIILVNKEVWKLSWCALQGEMGLPLYYEFLDFKQDIWFCLFCMSKEQCCMCNTTHGWHCNKIKFEWFNMVLSYKTNVCSLHTLLSPEFSLHSHLILILNLAWQPSYSIDRAEVKSSPLYLMMRKKAISSVAALQNNILLLCHVQVSSLESYICSDKANFRNLAQYQRDKNTLCTCK